MPAAIPRGMEQDVTIKQILYDVGNGSERKNIALRLWADCLDDI